VIEQLADDLPAEDYEFPPTQLDDLPDLSVLDPPSPSMFDD